MILKLLIATLPSLLIILVFVAYLYKRGELDFPVKRIGISMFSGMLIVVPLFFIEKEIYGYIAHISNAFMHGFLVALFGAAIPEELFKFLVLICIVRPKLTDHSSLHIILVSVSISLGFATIENALYISETGAAALAIRGFMSVPGHVMLGVIMGYFYSLAVQQNKLIKHTFYALLLPVFFHTFFDFPLLVLKHGTVDAETLFLFTNRGSRLFTSVWFCLMVTIAFNFLEKVIKKDRTLFEEERMAEMEEALRRDRRFEYERADEED